SFGGGGPQPPAGPLNDRELDLVPRAFSRRRGGRAEAKRDMTVARQRLERVHRLLDNSVPAVGRSRVGAVLALLRPCATHDQTVRGASQCDVEEAHMLLELALLVHDDDILERRAALVFLRA